MRESADGAHGRVCAGGQRCLRGKGELPAGVRRLEAPSRERDGKIVDAGRLCQCWFSTFSLDQPMNSGGSRFTPTGDAPRTLIRLALRRVGPCWTSNPLYSVGALFLFSGSLTWWGRVQASGVESDRESPTASCRRTILSAISRPANGIKPCKNLRASASASRF